MTLNEFVEQNVYEIIKDTEGKRVPDLVGQINLKIDSSTKNQKSTKQLKKEIKMIILKMIYDGRINLSDNFYVRMQHAST